MLYRVESPTAQPHVQHGWIECDVPTPAHLRAALRTAGLLAPSARVIVEQWPSGDWQVRHRDTEVWLVPEGHEDWPGVPVDPGRVWGAERPAPFVLWRSSGRRPRRRSTGLDPLRDLLRWGRGE